MAKTRSQTAPPPAAATAATSRPRRDPKPPARYADICYGAYGKEEGARPAARKKKSRARVTKPGPRKTTKAGRKPARAQKKTAAAVPASKKRKRGAASEEEEQPAKRVRRAESQPEEAERTASASAAANAPDGQEEPPATPAAPLDPGRAGASTPSLGGKRERDEREDEDGPATKKARVDGGGEEEAGEGEEEEELFEEEEPEFDVADMLPNRKDVLEDREEDLEGEAEAVQITDAEGIVRGSIPSAGQLPYRQQWMSVGASHLAIFFQQTRSLGFDFDPFDFHEDVTESTEVGIPETLTAEDWQPYAKTRQLCEPDNEEDVEEAGENLRIWWGHVQKANEAYEAFLQKRQQKERESVSGPSNSKKDSQRLQHDPRKAIEALGDLRAIPSSSTTPATISGASSAVPASLPPTLGPSTSSSGAQNRQHRPSGSSSVPSGMLGFQQLQTRAFANDDSDDEDESSVPAHLRRRITGTDDSDEE